MARKILLVEPITALRKILSGMILSGIDDALVVEADSFTTAEKQLENNAFHLVLFTFDTVNMEWKRFFEKARYAKDGHTIPFVLLAGKSQEKHAQEAVENGITEYLFVPCNTKKITEMINRVCNPIEMRVTNRYSVANTTVYLAQGSKRWQGHLANISAGGMLCDIEWTEDIQWASPFMNDLVFHDNNDMTINGLYSIMTSLRVNETHQDFSPKKIRSSFRFLTIPEESKKKLENIFRQEDEKTKQLVDQKA